MPSGQPSKPHSRSFSRRTPVLLVLGFLLVIFGIFIAGYVQPERFEVSNMCGARRERTYYRLLGQSDDFDRAANELSLAGTANGLAFTTPCEKGLPTSIVLR